MYQTFVKSPTYVLLIHLQNNFLRRELWLFPFCR